MDGGKSEAALSRIETALARIEAVVRRRDASSAASEERHQRLREAVHRSLRQLDDLIERQPETPDE